MRKTRKLFAGLTALCLSGTMLSALPVNAEDTVYATYSYTVVGTDNAEHPAKYVFADSSGDTWYTSADYFDMTLAVGDMITIQNAILGVTCIEGTNDLSIDKLDGYSAEKTGSILDNPKTAEFTVQEIQTGSQFGNRIYLEKDGVRYHIFTDWIEKNYAEYSYLDWDSVSVGDTVTCILYDNYPVIGTEKIYNRFFIVTDAENRIAEYYYHIDGALLHTSADFRNVSAEWNFKYGDVLTVDGNFYIKNGFPLLIKLDDTAVLSSQSCRDAFEIKELTVTEVLSDDVQQNIQLSLTDENGSSYSYTEHISMNYDFSIADVSAGTNCLFAVYEDTALLPLASLDGDADGNGNLDILDVITVNKAILGKENISADKIFHIDFNSNGIPDSEDALIMMKKIVGLV